MSTIWSKKKSRKQRRHKLNKAESINHSSYLKQFTMILSLSSMYVRECCCCLCLPISMCSTYSTYMHKRLLPFCVRNYFFFKRRLCKCVFLDTYDHADRRKKEMFWIESIFNILLKTFSRRKLKSLKLQGQSEVQTDAKCIFNSETENLNNFHWKKKKFCNLECCFFNFKD